MKLFNVSETQKQIIAFVILAFTLIALSLHISAVIVSDDAVTTDEYAYCMYDYETKEFSTHYAPKTNATETWQFFTEREVAQMSAATAIQTSSLSPSFVETPPLEGTAASAVVYIRAYYDTDGDNVPDHTSGGSGFLVSSNVVVTAAHCFLPLESYETEEIIPGAVLMSTAIHYDQHGSTLNSLCVNASRQYWSYGYTAAYEAVRERYDYCVIELEEPISRSFYFNCIPAENVEIDESVRLTGYPTNYLTSTNGRIVEFVDNLMYNLKYTNASASGMSGGPVYNSNGYCVGTHRGLARSLDYYYGVLFHSQFYSLICQRIEANN